MERVDLVCLVSAILTSGSVDSQTPAKDVISRYRDILRELRQTGGPTSGQTRLAKDKDEGGE